MTTTGSGLTRDEERAIEQDCQKVLLSLFHAVDEFDYETAISLFVEDGTWHRLGKPYTGHEALRKELNARSPTQVIRHVATNIIVTVIDADHAESVLYVTTYKHDDGVKHDGAVNIQTPLRLGVVRDRLVRRPEGWRIQEQGLQFVFEFA
ncbi:MAG: nuclear transport factor 2 family protein [Rhizobiaceae bacterium]